MKFIKSIKKKVMYLVNEALINFLVDELIADILTHKLSCIEAQERAKDIFKLIPFDEDWDFFYLNRVMKDTYGNDPNYTYSHMYTINIK